MLTPEDIDQPLFTVGELSRVAGLKMGLADKWIRRGLITPTRVVERAVRDRSLFSCIAIFEAKMTRVLSDFLAIGPSDSQQVVREVEALKLAKAAAGNPAWMWTGAREHDRGRVLDVVVLAWREGKCWRVEQLLGRHALPQHDERPAAFVQAGVMFDRVYADCKALSEGKPIATSSTE